MTSIAAPNTNTTWFTYCGCGSPETISTALHQVTTFIYDNAGRKTDTYYQDGTSEHFTYNARPVGAEHG